MSKAVDDILGFLRSEFLSAEDQAELIQRLSNYYSTTELAALCGVTAPAITNWNMRGLLPEPSITSINATVHLWSEEQALEIKAWNDDKVERRRKIRQLKAELKTLSQPRTSAGHPAESKNDNE